MRGITIHGTASVGVATLFSSAFCVLFLYKSWNPTQRERRQNKGVDRGLRYAASSVCVELARARRQLAHLAWLAKSPAGPAMHARPRRALCPLDGKMHVEDTRDPGRHLVAVHQRSHALGCPCGGAWWWWWWWCVCVCVCVCVCNGGGGSARSSRGVGATWKALACGKCGRALTCARHGLYSGQHRLRGHVPVRMVSPASRVKMLEMYLCRHRTRAWWRWRRRRCAAPRRIPRPRNGARHKARHEYRK